MLYCLVDPLLTLASRRPPIKRDPCFVFGCAVSRPESELRLLLPDGRQVFRTRRRGRQRGGRIRLRIGRIQ